MINGVYLLEKITLFLKKYIIKDDLKNIPLIISKQTNVDNFLAEWLGENIDNFNIVATYNLLYNATLMAKENIGNVLCLDGIINTNSSNLKFLPLKPELKTSLSIIWKKIRVYQMLLKNFWKT